jgi:GDP-L-fucose synthase
MYKGKKVLVTGGTGLVGRELVELLVKSGAIVTSISMDEDNFEKSWNVNHVVGDLRDINVCMEICKIKNIFFILQV